MEKSAKKIEAIPHNNSKSGSRGLFALMLAFTLAVLLAGAMAEKFSKQESVHRLDWIMFSAAAAIATILLGLVMANRRKPTALGEGEITVFDLELDDTAGPNERNKPVKSIGTLAESIRQTATEISMITERLAEAHASGSTSEKSQGSTMRSIVDSEADTLAQLDATTSEVALLAEETSVLNELIGAGLALAEAHATQSADHAKALESVAGISNQAMVKAGETALQVRAIERNRDALSLIGHEALTSMQQILRTVDETLLAFGDAAKNLDGENSGSKIPATQNYADTWFTRENMAQNSRVSSDSHSIAIVQELNAHLSKTAEYIQIARMNQALHAGRNRDTGETALDEAETMIRSGRDVAAKLELHIKRATTSGSGAIQDILSELGAMKTSNDELSAKTKKLSLIAGTTGQALGQIRHELLSESTRLERFLTRSTSLEHQKDSAIPELTMAASQIAHNCNRLAIDSQRLNIDGNNLVRRIEDIRTTSAANRGHLQRMQQSTGASIAKVEAIVKLVHGLVLNEDSATRRSTANAAQFSIHTKLALIDRFALRVIEMESKVKRMRGPSPAMDRSEMEKLPEYEFPVH